MKYAEGSMNHAVVIVCSLVACTAQADSYGGVGQNSPVTPTQAPPTPTKTQPSPEQRARDVLDKQLKALPGDEAALKATFAKTAVVSVPTFTAKIDDPSLQLAAQIAFMDPHAEMKSAKLTQLVAAGGTSSMVWFAAEIKVVVQSAEPGEPSSTATHVVRAIELLDGTSDWKVVAASFSEGRALGQRRHPGWPVAAPTPAGSLVKLLADPTGLASSLASDPVVVFGSDATERAVGSSAAATLLSKWKKLPLAIEEETKVREVHTSAWAYAMAKVNIAKPGGPPYRMSGFVIAVPSANGAWSVVAASYGAL